MPTGHKISEESWAYVRDNYLRMTNGEMAGAIGSCTAAVGAYLRRSGLLRPRELTHKMKEDAKRRSVVKRKALGTYRLAGFAAEDYVSPHIFKKGHRLYANFSDEKKKEVLKHKSESRKKLYASERRRIMFGLEPRTNILVSMLPQKERNRRYNLRTKLRKFGYIIPIYSMDNTVYITDRTVRSLKYEKAIKAIGYKIINQTKSSSHD